MFEADFRDEHTEKKVSQEDRRFLRIMEENFHQRADKHFEGPLPLKDQNVKFPDNKKLALKRLFCLKRRLANDKKFSDDYNKFMADSFNKGYAERVPEDELGNDDGRVWFVPHHGVYHAKKGKIRVVYDCSAEYQGFSLNNSLLQGPDFINNLLGVIIRFRKDEVAISCDIQEMFNQVLVTEQHRDLLRFLWWENGDLSGEPVQYRMKTHLFGAVSSPACAMYALNATADTYEQKYGKEAADFVRHNFYVDDGLISVPDADTAARLAMDTIHLCADGGFKLNKRYVSNKGKIKIYELHHFSDASTSGYGQVTYLRTIDELGHICSGLVISKAKVTPKRAVTIPRLELTAAVLSVKVASFLDKKLNIRNLRHFFWTDSMVVLGYIGNESRRFQVFVANRVQQIREHTVPDQWRFVKSEDNPADLASRGLDASELKNCDLWWHGPKFLMDSAELSAEPWFVEVQEDDPEVKKTRVLVTSSRQDDAKFDLSSRLVPFSSWFRAKKAVAICLRYRRRLLNRIRQKRTCSTTTEGMEESKSLTDMPIDTDELNDAEVTILKNVQEDEFEEELVNLATQEDPTTDRKQVKKRSSVRRLDPFLARDGLLRVGGRLRRSDLPLETAHPVILPKDHHVSRLIIAHFHEKTKHSGRTMTLSEIRLSGFWILHGRTAVSRYIQKCVKCIKLRGTPCGQKMADLPEERVGQMEPFTYSGCDCFGPFIIKERRSELKRWGIVFTCMSSRAVHLETLNSLTADAFINAYRRFVSRRGPVRKLFCDNATNFIGGEGYLMAALNEMDRDQVRRTILKDNCDIVEFDHITPRASHMGGAWERQIRQRWRRVQYLSNQFWLRWRREFLPTLQERRKWNRTELNLEPGDVVIIVDADAPRCSWPLGRVVSTYPSSDGLL
ncbi:uncharacterized protein LOC122384292 [Amphibalanus amphitrite]|uniref:uncharacterized protein LOC122384292 n=1 Tax=Amphibalanus amphitrite TaxID=1232801 RepID=UPI001C90F9A0|nr:uncharacterized protein LOC122384292 [Amphibalanus amphitrite]